MTDQVKSVQELAQQFMGNGWQGLDGADKIAEAQKAANAQRSYEEASLVARVFNTPQGQDFLETLRDKTERAPCFDPDMANPVERGFFREGQNSIVRWIDAMVAKAAEGPPSAKKAGGTNTPKPTRKRK